MDAIDVSAIALLFQHTAARRRLITDLVFKSIGLIVSTHSRPKAADTVEKLINFLKNVSTHSRPKAAERTE